MERTIFHVDLDAFFVAVERLLDPSLVGKPVVVGGMGPRGVVSAASYEVRKFGVHSALPMSTARRLAPRAIFMSPTHGVYGKVSRRFKSILEDFSPDVHSASIDEAYLDMTGCERLLGPPFESASAIKRRVRDELSVVASVGVGPNDVVAKVASEESKPDGLLIVRGSDAAEFFAPLAVSKLPGIGPKATERLRALGIGTLGELARAPLGVLVRSFGQRHAEYLRRRAAGEGSSTRSVREAAKSISSERTFDYDVLDRDRLDAVALSLSEKVGRRLRRAERKARVVVLKLRYGDFTTVSRRCTLSPAVDGDLAIHGAASGLLWEVLRERLDPVRLIGVAVSGLVERETQLSMLGDSSGLEDSAVSVAIDAIRERYGDGAIVRGRLASFGGGV